MFIAWQLLFPPTLLAANEDDSTSACSTMRSGYIGDVVWGGNQFVAVGANGLILTSPDGAYWSVVRPKGAYWGQYKQGHCPQGLMSVAWGNGLYVASGVKNELLTSSDGITWQVQSPIDPQGKQGFRLAWERGLFVAVGNAGAVFTSLDGARWNRESSGTEDDLVDVSPYREGFVAIGKRGTAILSKDGHLWASSRTGIDQLDRVTTNGSLLVATANLAYGTTVATSADGKTWSNKHYPGYEHLYNDVVWSDGLFVMVGSDIAMSTRAQHWTFLNAKPYGIRRPILERVAGNGTIFVAFGSNAEILASYDGANWFGGSPALIDQDARTYMVHGIPVDEDPGVETEVLLREGVNQASVYGPVWAGTTIALLALYLMLQIIVVLRTQGFWRIAAIVPALALFAPPVGQIIVHSFFSGLVLWPLWPFRPTDLRIPAAISSLLIIYGLWYAFVKGWMRLPQKVKESQEKSLANSNVDGWMLLGLICGVMPNSMMLIAIGPLPLLCLSIGQPILLKSWVKTPTAWFIWTLIGGTIGYFVGGSIAIPALFMGGPNFGPAISIGFVAIAQTFSLSKVGRESLKYWIPVNIFAVLMATSLTNLLLKVSDFKGHEIFRFVQHYFGVGEHAASLLHTAAFSIPQYLLYSLAVGLYVSRKFANINSPATTKMP